MSAPAGYLLDVLVTIGHYLDMLEYALFRLSLFASFVLLLRRLFLKELRRR